MTLHISVVYPGIRATVTPSNGAEDNLPSLASINPRDTPQSSCASTSEIRHVRGRTHGLALEKTHIAGKLSVFISDGRTGGDDKASSMLSSHIDSLVRSHVYFDVVNWSKVPDEVKSYVMNKVLCESERRSFTEVEIFTKVLRMKAGYVHGLGHSMRQVGSSLLMLSVDLVQRLEEARMEIEEMRARQKEYDELAMRQAEMKRLMREQQQHLMEQKQHLEEQ
ncbi:hypothetical protein CJ030_MR3G009901 [Morella rubra]|uniref:Uncharacterized protein n=1 Tax=Morella rubra TaxID=262757 RepID=A0A6A1W5F8_9ROSI|nr:hypothetical protein CJ030_MR3G009901 [Morella rubra]